MQLGGLNSGQYRESLRIQRIAAVHLFVRDLERSRDHYVNRLGFTQVAVSGQEFEVEHHARAAVVEAGGARFVLMEPLGCKGESFRWLEKHPEGVARVVFDVSDVEHAFRTVLERGGTCSTGIRRRELDGGVVAWFDIATAIGDTRFRFIEHVGRTPLMPDLVPVSAGPGQSNPFGISEVDHITSNFLTLQPALSWMEKVLGLERYWSVDFHTQDVSRGRFGGSGLRSVVMWDPVSTVRFANNEPAAPCFEASQIYLFCEDHRGAGVQHVALAVPDIVRAVREMRGAGVKFMSTPGTYYDMLPERLDKLGVGTLGEDVDELRELGILVDGEGEGKYLLQIFMKEAAAQFGDPQAGPLFIELIQRHGDRGFGAGNFRALFESIERQQQLEGRAQ